MSGARGKVGEILTLTRRPVEVHLDESYEEIGIRSFGRGIFHKEPVSGAELGSKRVFRIEPGDLLLSNVFAWEGAVALAGQTERGKIGSHRFMTYTPVDDRIDTNWASWFFRSEPGLELIRKASPGSAGRNKTLAIDRFEALEIPLPPIDEQRRIAASLDRVAVAAAEAARLADRASKLSAALAVSLATRPDVSDRMKYESGWRRLPLSDAADPAGVATTVQPSQRYQIAGVYSFGRGLIDRGWIAGSDTSYSTLTKIQMGDIVLSKLNGWEGAIAVVDTQFDGFYVSSEYPVFAPRPGLLTSDYFAGLAASPEFWAALDVSARGSMVRRRRISSNEFLATHVWIPPIDVQSSVVRVLAPMRNITNARRAATDRIRALVPSALNAAFGTQHWH